MKSRQQKQTEAIQRNLKHIQKYVNQAVESGGWAHVAKMNFVAKKLGIPNSNREYDSLLYGLIDEAVKAKEAA